MAWASLVCIVLGVLAAIGRRIRKPERTLYAAAFAAAVVWTIHAGFDWDWQMPAVTLPVFVLAGCAAGYAKSARTDRRHAPRLESGVGPPRAGMRRPVTALLALLAAAAPGFVGVSQRGQDTSVLDFGRNDCAAAAPAARRSLAPLNFRHAAAEILAYCDAAEGARMSAVTEMTQAVHDDPKNWETEYGLAVVLASAGKDPRPAARAAAALNRHEPVVSLLVSTLRRDPRARWPADAETSPLPIDGEYGTALIVLRAAQRSP